jgi:GTP-binding protein
MFVDHINLTVSTGSGGSGSISFKNTQSKTSPNGGSGGSGGGIKFVVNNSLSDLSHIMTESSLKASNGSDGNKNFQNGKDGEDLIIEIPQGTQIKANEQTLADMHENKSEFILDKGGKAGAGNFALASNRVPNPEFAERGQKRKSYKVNLLYSIYSDVVILGMPNAGKSTLITKLTNSNAKIGAYEFTTTSPNLGVINESIYPIKICDLPGLIQGASEGVGLGKKILNHIRNTKIVVYLLDPTRLDKSIEEQLKILDEELELFDKNYLKIQKIIAVNKIDTQTYNYDKFFNISAKNSLNLESLVSEIINCYKNVEDRLYSDYQKISLENYSYEIHKEGREYKCSGEVVNHIVGLSGNIDAVNQEIFFRFENSPLLAGLKSKGIKNGDIVKLENMEFEYHE